MKNNVFVLSMVCHDEINNLDIKEINAVFSDEERAKKMAEHFINMVPFDGKKYIDYKIHNFCVL